MPIAKHIAGGSVSFVHDGQRITAGRGYVGEVPQRILAKHPKRFEVMNLSFPRITADVKQGEAVTREVSTQVQSTKLDFYIARHRGGGRWHVTETESGKVVSEAMAKDEAIAKSEEMNAARPR